MRVSKRTYPEQRGFEAALERVDRSAFQRGALLHVRQQAGQPRREHRFAAARRPEHEQGMLSGRGDLEGPAGVALTLDVGQLRVGGTAPLGNACIGRERRHAIEVGTHFEQGVGRQDPQPRHQRGLRGVVRRQDQGARLAHRLAGHGQHPPHRPKLARQRQLADELMLVEPLRLDLARGDQDADRDRQIEATAFLGKIGRREIDGNAPLRKPESGGLQGGAYSVPRLAHLGVGKAHKAEGGQAVGQMCLDDHDRGVHAVERAAANESE